MRVALVVDVSARFQLQCRVRDIEVARQAQLESVQDLWRVTRIEASVLDRDVSRQCRGSRSKCPRVEIVDVKDVVNLDEVRSYIVEIQVARRGLQQYLARIAQESPRRPQHQRNDQQ